MLLAVLLTGKVRPEACLSRDHPLGSGLTENGQCAFRLLAQSSQSTAKVRDHDVHFLVRKPAIIPQNQLEGESCSSLVIIILFCYFWVFLRLINA